MRYVNNALFVLECVNLKNILFLALGATCLPIVATVVLIGLVLLWFAIVCIMVGLVCLAWWDIAKMQLQWLTTPIPQTVTATTETIPSATIVNATNKVDMAVEMYLAQKCPVSWAAKTYEIPASTLRRKLRKLKKVLAIPNENV